MTQSPHPSPKSEEILQVLQQAVAEALDKKQRLGQYAVNWKDGAPVMVSGEVDDMEVPAVLGETAMLEELADQELNRKVLGRMGERALAIEVDIDDI
jgi:hypothetical protein